MNTPNKRASPSEGVLSAAEQAERLMLVIENANFPREQIDIADVWAVCKALRAAAAQAAEPKFKHEWDRDGERCVHCGDKDWMGGECGGPRAKANPATQAAGAGAAEPVAEDGRPNMLSHADYGDGFEAGKEMAMRAVSKCIGLYRSENTLHVRFASRADAEAAFVVIQEGAPDAASTPAAAPFTDAALAEYVEGFLAPDGELNRSDAYRLARGIRDRASLPAEKAAPAGEAEPSEDEQQAAFEKWALDVCPSGDVEDVQRQWEQSSDYLDLFDRATSASTPAGEARQCVNCGGTFTPHQLDTGWIGRCECAAHLQPSGAVQAAPVAQRDDELVKAGIRLILNTKDGRSWDDVVRDILALRAATPPAVAPSQPSGAVSEALNYASELAKALFEKHYASDPEYASGKVVWGLCDDLPGILTQIDNMVSGLVRPVTPTGLGAQVGAPSEPVAYRVRYLNKSPASGTQAEGGPFHSKVRNPQWEVVTKKYGESLLAEQRVYAGEYGEASDHPSVTMQIEPLYVVTPPSHEAREPLVTRDSAIRAIEHVAIHNGPGREREAIKMLVIAGQPGEAG